MSHMRHTHTNTGRIQHTQKVYMAETASSIHSWQGVGGGCGRRWARLLCHVPWGDAQHLAMGKGDSDERMNLQCQVVANAVDAVVIAAEFNAFTRRVLRCSYDSERKNAHRPYIHVAITHYTVASYQRIDIIAISRSAHCRNILPLNHITKPNM